MTEWEENALAEMAPGRFPLDNCFLLCNNSYITFVIYHPLLFSTIPPERSPTMPPTPKITKDMILNAVLDITRERGFDAVNARSIASRLSCSTRPIFTCYESMDGLKREFLDFAFTFYSAYAERYGRRAAVSPALYFPLSYIQFAREETHLFRLLFLSDMDLDMKAPGDFYREPENEKKAVEFARQTGLEPEQGKAVFLDLFLYAHGMAVLASTGKLSLDEACAKAMIEHLLSALIRQARQEEPGGAL